MNLAKKLLPLLVVAAITSACGGDSGGPTGVDSHGVIRVSNTSSFTITEINVSRCELLEWGSNRVGSPVTPGNFVEIELTPNCYDLRVILNNGQHFEFFDLLIQAGGTQPITVFDL